MSGQIRTNPDTDCTSDGLELVLAQLTAEQVRYAIARRESKDITEACRAIGMRRQRYHEWPENERSLIDEVVRLMERDGVVTALHLRRRSLAEAMGVKTAGLRDPDPKLRQGVATELIEWELGKAKQSMDTNVHGDVRVTHNIEHDIAKVYGTDSE